MILQQPMDQYEAAYALLKYVCSGVLGSTTGMAVMYALMHTTDSTFVYSAALEPITGPPGPVDKYRIEVDRRTKELSTPSILEISNGDMQKAIFAATGETVASSCRFTDEGFSIS
nr:hypothetical protein CFP56_20604 [Quercus suber]